jgi:hypothetical protein
MTPDLYDAWLTAGNNLQPIGDWFAAHWPGLAILAAGLAAVAWSIRSFIRASHDDQRTRNDRAMAQRITRFEPRPEPGQPGQDQQLLQQCHAICPELARKEKPQP